MNNKISSPTLEKFRYLLSNYQPHKEICEQFQTSNFAVIAGPVVAGKDTLRDKLLAEQPDKYERITSLTTRALREGEIDGETYDFVSIPRMKELIKQKRLLQAALVHNQQISAVDARKIQQLAKDKVGLSILIVQTEQELYKINSNIKTIFSNPAKYRGDDVQA